MDNPLQKALADLRQSQLTILQALNVLEKHPIMAQSAAFRDLKKWVLKGDRHIASLREVKLS